MKIILSIIIVYLSICSAVFGQKSYHLDAQADTLFAEMVMFKKHDDIAFYVLDKNMNHINVKGIKAIVNFSFGKGSSVPVKVNSQYDNRFVIEIPREYWEGFLTCELFITMNDKTIKFTFVAPLREKKKHADSPVPTGDGHGH